MTTSSHTVLEEIDSSLAQDARDLKTILFNSKEIIDEYRNLVLTHLASQGAAHILDRSSNSHNAAFKVILKNILNLGAGLANTKEVRDILGTVMEKIVEPCLGMGWSPSDLDMFLAGVLAQFRNVDSITPNYRRKYMSSFERLVHAVAATGVRFAEETTKLV